MEIKTFNKIDNSSLDFVTVKVYDSSGKLLASTQTNADGEVIIGNDIMQPAAKVTFSRVGFNNLTVFFPAFNGNAFMQQKDVVLETAVLVSKKSKPLVIKNPFESSAPQSATEKKKFPFVPVAIVGAVALGVGIFYLTKN